MTPEQRLKYIECGLRFSNIELHPDLLKKVLEVVDLINEKKCNTTIMDLVKINKKKK